MNHPFESKGIFSWQTPAVAKGEPEGFADVLLEAGFESVYLKVADGPYPYKVLKGLTYQENVTAELVAAIRARGIAVVGWGFLFGKNPVGEGQIAASQVNRFGLDGYVFDVEKSFEDQAGRVNNARDVMAIFRARCAEETPAAFCGWQLFKSWTGGTWHPVDYAQAFMERADYGMPMIYWWGGNTPERAMIHLHECMKQWQSLITLKPLIPAGRAYNGDSGDATPEAMLTFEAGVRAKEMRGISWWVLDQAANPKYQGGRILQTLTEMAGFAVVGPPEPPPMVKPKVTIMVEGEVEVEVRRG